MRLLALSETLTGFGFISLAVTYLVSLTAALERKRRSPFLLPSGPPGRRRRGALDPPFVGGRFVGLESIFAGAALDLQGLLESHIEHPLIHYFHPHMCTTSTSQTNATSLTGEGTPTREYLVYLWFRGLLGF
jgi:hypothetical protein